MNLDIKAAVVITVAVSGLAAGAYTLGVKQGKQKSDTEVATKQQSVPATSVAQLPANHSPISTPPSGKGNYAGADPNAKFTHFRVGNRNVKSILSDNGTMWIGTSGGVIRYDIASDKYKLFNTSNGLLSNGVFYVGKLKDKIAVGTYGGGLSLLDPETEKWSNYNVPQGLADAFVYEVLEAKNGDLWIATWSGANRIRGGNLADRSKWDTFTVENTQGGLPNDWVYALEEGSDGDIWLGTEGGLAHFKNDKWQNWQHTDGLGAPFEKVKADIQFKNDPAKMSSHHARQKTEQGLEDVDVAYNPNYIISMLVDDNKNVWCGTWGGGLARFDGKSWVNFTMKEGLPSNHIFMLSKDNDGNVWIGTSAGLVLAKENGNSFKTFTIDDGLFSNNVFSMSDSVSGEKWIGSYGGVAKIVNLN